MWITWRICWPPAPCVAKMEPGERTMEPIDCTAEGTGVADRVGWVTALLGAGLTVVLVVQAERGLLSERSTGSVWSSVGLG